MSTSKLYLLRHFPTPSNNRGMIIGQSNAIVDSDLDKNNYFSQIPHNIVKILCSPLQRCQVTANSLQKKYQLSSMRVPQILTFPLLKERHMGDWEGQLKKKVIIENPELFEDGYMIPRVTPPNGESFSDFLSRGEILLNRTKEELEMGNIVVCAHNQILKLFVHLYFGDYLLGNWSKIHFIHGQIVDVLDFSKIINNCN